MQGGLGGPGQNNGPWDQNKSCGKVVAKDTGCFSYKADFGCGWAQQVNDKYRATKDYKCGELMDNPRGYGQPGQFFPKMVVYCKTCGEANEFPLGKQF